MKWLCLVAHKWRYLWDGRFRQCERCARLAERRSHPDGDVVYREFKNK